MQFALKVQLSYFKLRTRSFKEKTYSICSTKKYHRKAIKFGTDIYLNILLVLKYKTIPMVSSEGHIVMKVENVWGIHPAQKRERASFKAVKTTESLNGLLFKFV